MWKIRADFWHNVSCVCCVGCIQSFLFHSLCGFPQGRTVIPSFSILVLLPLHFCLPSNFFLSFPFSSFFTFPFIFLLFSVSFLNIASFLLLPTLFSLFYAFLLTFVCFISLFNLHSVLYLKFKTIFTSILTFILSFHFHWTLISFYLKVIQPFLFNFFFFHHWYFFFLIDPKSFIFLKIFNSFFDTCFSQLSLSANFTFTLIHSPPLLSSFNILVFFFFFFLTFSQFTFLTWSSFSYFFIASHFPLLLFTFVFFLLDTLQFIKFSCLFLTSTLSNNILPSFFCIATSSLSSWD